MANLLSFLFEGDKANDVVIANDMIAGSKGAATAYLAATLECATPELRAMLSDSLNQIIASHSALTALAVNKGWYKPYQAPDEQLAEIFTQSQKFINSMENRM